MGKRGGQRPGAGRPRISEDVRVVRVTVALLASHIEFLLSRSRNISQALRQLIDREIQNENTDKNRRNDK
jgi:hypothetical protein